MLVNKKKYEDGATVTFKIVNGDEIVARLVREDETGLLVSNPMAVIMAQKGLMLVPALFTVETGQEIHVDFRHIMFHSVTNDQMSMHYVEQTTGIKPVTRGSIIV